MAVASPETAGCSLERPPGRLVPASFFARPAEEVAPGLIGLVLWRDGVGGGRLVEVEAYLPVVDPASHGHRGRTPRNAGLFGPPGTLYVYVSYGIHRCVNLVCYRDGVGTGILVRALEPLGDTSVLRRNRGDGAARLPPALLMSGPGRVGQALGAGLEWNGLPLGPASGVVLLDDGVRPPVERTARIGISRATELPLRFIVPGSRFLSRPPRRGEPVREGPEGESTEEE